MRGFLARHTPSPAMAVAFVALLAALSGTAIALPGKNSVDKNDIRKGAVRGKAIAKNAVTSGKVKNNAITGADVNEGTLGQVPSAGSANTANTANTATSAASATTAASADSVGGVRFRSFSYNVDNSGPATQILDFAGLTLTASCSADILSLSAGSSVADTEVGSYSVEADDGTGPQNAAYTGDLDPAESVDLVPSDEDEEVGSLRYTKPDGTGVHVQFHVWGGNNGLAGGRCAVNGVASAF